MLSVFFDCVYFFYVPSHIFLCPKGTQPKRWEKDEENNPHKQYTMIKTTKFREDTLILSCVKNKVNFYFVSFR